MNILRRVITTLVLLQVCLADVREWTREADGKKIKGELVSYNASSGAVKIKINGKVFDLEADVFSSSDQEFLSSIQDRAQADALAVFAERHTGYSAQPDLSIEGPEIEEYGIKTVKFQGWVPEGVETLRGTLVLVAGRFGDWKGKVNDTDYQQIAEANDLALLGCEFSDGEKKEYQRDEGVVPESILIAVEGLAAASGHPELSFAPLAMHGISAGSNVSAAVARVYPDRVITAVGMAAPNGPGQSNSDSLELPMFYTMGAKDKDSFLEYTKMWLMKGRAEDAVWGAVTFPNEGHGGPLAKEISLLYLREIIPLRLDLDAKAPNEILKRGKSYPMENIEIKEGYLANPAKQTTAPYKEYEGKKDDAYWLPTKAIAELWEKLSK